MFLNIQKTVFVAFCVTTKFWPLRSGGEIIIDWSKAGMADAASRGPQQPGNVGARVRPVGRGQKVAKCIKLNCAHYFSHLWVYRTKMMASTF